MKYAVAQLLLETGAVKIQPEKPFTWTSGITSPIYCDNRRMISFPEAVNTVTLAFKEMVVDKNLKFDVIAGTATAGIPWASFLAYDLDVPMIYIRSKPKGHGTNSQIEGVLEKGQKVLIVEDLVSTGKSSLGAVNAVQSEGGKVSDVVSIFQYGFPVAENAFKDAGVRLESITNFPTLLEEIEDMDAETKKHVLAFSKNPEKWKK